MQPAVAPSVPGRENSAAASPHAPFERLDSFDRSSSEGSIGEQLRLVREDAARFRRRFSSTGFPEYVETFDLAKVPYPTEFGLFRAHKSRAPFVMFVNRMMVIRYKDLAGVRRTLVWEPSDVELGRNVPFYAALAKRTPKFLQNLGSGVMGSVEQHLGGIGIDPREVDYLAFDHLHVQDCRRLVGTNGPAPDISPGAPVAPQFPNAKLIVQRAEWDLVRSMHPWQAPWYQPDTYRDLRDGAVSLIEGDVLLGEGVALLSTPGHSSGMMSLALNTGTGIWASSENVIAAELLTPEQSEIPGVRQSARRWGLEVILNGNTIENTTLQYNSVIKEKCVVDRSVVDGRFLQFFPTSELAPSWMSPGAKPTFAHGKLQHGRLVRES